MTQQLIEKFDCLEGMFLLTAAWGGKDGRVVQITTGENSHVGYSILTFDDAKKTFAKAIREIKKLEKEYNENPPFWEVISKSEKSAKGN